MEVLIIVMLLCIFLAVIDPVLLGVVELALVVLFVIAACAA